MKYKNSIDIWKLSDSEIEKLQPGQWVYAGGDTSNKGVYLGYKKSGTLVVAWKGNWHKINYRKYLTSLRDYAKSI